MDYLGLIFEFGFLIMGVYLYLFSIGKVSTSNPSKKEESEAFRNKNKRWLKPLSLLLIAMMTVEIFLHIQQLWF